MEYIGGEQRQHHIEIDPEQRDHPNDCYYQEDGWHVPDVEQTLAQALERAEFLIVRSSTGQGVQRSLIDHDQSDDDSEKTDGVQQKKRRDAEPGNAPTTETWPQHTSHIDERRVERDRIRHIFATHHLTHEC